MRKSRILIINSSDELDSFCSSLGEDVEILRAADTKEALQLLAPQSCDYERHLDTILDMNSGIVCSFQLNLSQNTCSGAAIGPFCGIFDESTAADVFFDRIYSRIPFPNEQALFLKSFGREKLLETFQSGNLHVSLVHALLDNQTHRHLVTSCADIQINPATDDIEAIFYAKDITERYVEDTVSRFIFSKGYDSLSIIDLLKDCYSILSFQENGLQSLHNEDISFTEGRERDALKHISPEDRLKFLHNTEISVIREELSQQQSYSFHIRFLDTFGRRCFKKYSYYYLIRDVEAVLCTVEDVTNEMEHDDVTGELNRRGFIDYTEVVLKENQENTQYAILFIDIINFKAINELLGSPGGDDILRQFTQYLKSSFLQPLAVAHLSGTDHFLCLMRQNSLALDSLRDLLHHTFACNTRSVDLYGQCGIYLIDSNEISVSGMCDCARLASNHITDAYIQPYAFYSQTMREEYLNRAGVTSELKHALAADEFKVFFQPIYDLRTNQIVSAEALVRWINPQRGMIPPNLFIPILEENGHISKLDLFVAQNVEHFIDSRKASNQFVVPVSVNLSGMDFNDKVMMDTLLETVRRQGQSGAIRFEITETSYVNMSQENNDLTRRLRHAGSKLLIDDFGSGYSSFSILMDYDFDIIKLDIGFVRKIGRSPKTESIIRSIIEMSHNIDVRVIAEGVETKEQVDFLSRNGCDYVQGYYFSKPLPQKDFEELLNLCS